MTDNYTFQVNEKYTVYYTPDYKLIFFCEPKTRNTIFTLVSYDDDNVYYDDSVEYNRLNEKYYDIMTPTDDMDYLDINLILKNRGYKIKDLCKVGKFYKKSNPCDRDKFGDMIMITDMIVRLSKENNMITNLGLKHYLGDCWMTIMHP